MTDYFIFSKSVFEMVFLFNELFDLVGQSDVGQKEAAVFGIVSIFALILVSI